MRDWARYERVVLLRRSGKTFREIGGELGVSRERARQMYRYSLWRLRLSFAHLLSLTDEERQRWSG